MVSTFPENRVRVARKFFEQCENYDDNRWKKEALNTLKALDGKELNAGAISTVLTTASYSRENWSLVEKMFEEYNLSHPDASFPQTLFRRLQGVPSAKRQVYLSKAGGTNGLRVAKLITEDRRRKNMKSIAINFVGEWENLEEEVRSKIMEYEGNIETEIGRKQFINFVQNVSKGNMDIEVEIKIKKNGNDISHQYEHLIKKYIHKIKVVAERKDQNASEE